jgi:hypothetical protein
MRKAATHLAPMLLLAALALALPATISAQNREKFVISARAGGVNAVTGGTSLSRHGNNEWRQLTIKEDLETGDVVKTGTDGRVELLLNPGSYMRVSENSEFEMADSSLDNLEVRLIKGTAILEVTGVDDEELFIGITTPHTRMSIIRRGLYRVSVVPGDNTELIVRKGRVMLEGSHTKVKGGDKVVFNNNTFSVAKATDVEKKDRDAFDSWSRERAQLLAKENSKLSRRTLDSFASSFRNDWGFSGLWGGSGIWFFSSGFGCYTFIPFYNAYGSPYGGWYGRAFYGGGPGWGRGIYPGPVYTGPVGNSGNSTGSRGSSGSGSPGYTPPPSSGRIVDAPMTGRSKPDISPGGAGIRPDNQH